MMKLKKNLFAANFIQKIFEEISKREGKVPLPSGGENFSVSRALHQA